MFPPMTLRRDHAANQAIPTRGLDARLTGLVEQGLAGDAMARADASWVLGTAPEGGAPPAPLLPLVHAAGLVRRKWWGDLVQVHVLNNVQNGACPEDCGYCGQSRASKAPIQPYRLKSREQIVGEAQAAKESGAFRYCMVLSGRGPSDADIDHMVECIREVKSRFGLRTCLSAGLMDEAKARRLKDAGLDQLNHNLNTSERHYASICSTHTYKDRIDTLAAARAAGLSLCSGLIVGMGERVEDVVDVAYALRAVRAESIPVNFLVPIPGNAVREPGMADRALTPEFCLRVLCLMRLVNPTSEVRAAAGREGHLRSLQPLALEAANSLFIDGYLLTKGSAAIETLRMVRDCGFRLKLEGAEWPEPIRRYAETGDLSGFGDGDDERGLGVIKPDKLSGRKLARLRINGAEAGAPVV